MAEIVSLTEGVAAAVHDEDTLAMEGFTHLIPFAAGHEIIRQGRRDLVLVRMTPDLIYDQLIGMGCAAKLVFSWGGNPGVGSLHRFRDAVVSGCLAGIATMAVIYVSSIVRVNVFLDQIRYRGDWVNLVSRFHASGFHSLRAYANYEYFRQLPLLLTLGAVVGGCCGTVAGTINGRIRKGVPRI